jgi:hypothetical protein
MKILDPLKGESVVVDLAAYRDRRSHVIEAYTLIEDDSTTGVIEQHRQRVPRLAEDDEPQPPFEDYAVVFYPDVSRDGEDDSA